VEWRQRCLCLLVVESLMIAWFLSSTALCTDSVVIGGTNQQKRFVTCIAELTVHEFLNTPHSAEPLTIVILEHQKFMKIRDLFHAYRTERAFSQLAARRIYLSSRVFENFQTAQHYIAHELGHFVTRSVFEDNADLGAKRITQRAQQMCWTGIRE
jgi:hypothetical protein